jgi:hypothetical protein
LVSDQLTEPVSPAADDLAAAPNVTTLVDEEVEAVMALEQAVPTPVIAQV